MIGWSGPEYQAVPLILEAGLGVGAFQPQDGLVYREAAELGGQELLPLLSIAPCPVHRVEQLNVFLQQVSLVNPAACRAVCQ
jgi:hypothetical protein